MRPNESAYDRSTAETRSTDPGPARYALVTDHNGPCSIVGDYESLADAIEAARSLDTDEAPTELEDELDFDATDQSVAWLIAQAEAQGWRVVASAPAGEYWTVLVEGDPADATIDVPLPASARCYVVSPYAADGHGLVIDGHHVSSHIRTYETLGEAIAAAQQWSDLTHGTWTPGADMLEEELAAADLDAGSRYVGRAYEAIAYHESEDEGCGGVTIIAVL